MYGVNADDRQWAGVGVSYHAPEFVVYKNYFVYKQYTAFIRPNSTILAGLPTNHLGAIWPGPSHPLKILEMTHDNP